MSIPEVFYLAPTAYEQARRKQQECTPKQRERQARAEIRLAEKRLTDTLNRRHVTGEHLLALRAAANTYMQHGHAIPPDVRFLLALYEHAQRQALEEERVG